MMYMIDHEEIKEWAEKYNAKPQIIDDPASQADVPGLRIDFPGSSDESEMQADFPVVRDISWEDFFIKFEEDDLAIALNDNQSTNPSTNYMFIKRSVIGSA